MTRYKTFIDSFGGPSGPRDGLDDLLAALEVGRDADGPLRDRPLVLAELIERAALHGLDRVVAAGLVAKPELLTRIESDPLRQRLRDAAAVDLARQEALRTLAAAWRAADVEAIWIKGEAAARTVYPASHLRPRRDSDVLVAPVARAAAEAVLASLGYVRASESDGAQVSFQSHWTGHASHGNGVTIDLHWRLFNAEAFAAVLTVEEIAAASTVWRGELRLPSLEHQLVAAAVHRVAHHYDAPHLLWIYDVHLLARALGRDRLRGAGALAAARGMGPVFARALQRAREAFHSDVPANWIEPWASAPSAPHIAPFMRSSRQIDLLRSDLGALDRWPARLGLLREHLFPSAEYMRQGYAPGSRLPLPILYALCALRGAPKWLKRR